MNVKEIISIADKVSGSKAVKAGKWGLFGLVITLVSTYGPIVNEKYNRFEKALQAADSVEVYKTQVTKEIEQLRISQQFNKQGQDYINKSLDRRVTVLSDRELSKDLPLLAELDRTDTSGVILYESNEGDLWHYHQGWTHQATFSRADGTFYYINNINKRKPVK